MRGDHCDVGRWGVGGEWFDGDEDGDEDEVGNYCCQAGEPLRRDLMTYDWTVYPPACLSLPSLERAPPSFALLFPPT